MEILIPLGEVFLAAITHATLQLSLGSLLLLYHASQGKHIKKQTRGLVGSYVAGVGTLVMLMLATLTFVFDRWFGGALYVEEMMIVVSALIALALISWLFYYRRGRNTELWLPRRVANFITLRAKKTNNNTEAYALGLLTSLAELPFTLTLMVVTSNSLMMLNDGWQLLAWTIYTVVAILPLLTLRWGVRRGKTVVQIQQWRVKHKMFFWILTGMSFLVLGIFMLAFEVLV